MNNKNKQAIVKREILPVFQKKKQVKRTWANPWHPSSLLVSTRSSQRTITRRQHNAASLSK